MEQKVTPQSVRGLGNVCDNFSESDFTKINADTILQPNVNVNNINLRCFRVQMKGTDLVISTSEDIPPLKYGEPTTLGVTLTTAEDNTAVEGLIVGLYINDKLMAQSGITDSTGYTTITYTPNIYGNVTLEFKALPQGSYAMAKTTRNVSINIGTIITVYSPYVPQGNNKISGFAVWVTAEDGTIIDTVVSMSNGEYLHTQNTSALELLTVLDNVPVGTSITYSFTGEGFYESSTATKNAGSDGSFLTTTPPALPNGGK